MGIAFHHAGLTDDTKTIIEQSHKNKEMRTKLFNWGHVIKYFKS